MKKEDFAEYGRRGDTLADTTMAVVVEDRLQGDVNRFLTELLYATDAHDLKDPHPRMEDFLTATRQLPDWVDQERVIRGQELFNRHGPVCLLSLIQASLPECYVNSRIASVLGETQKLESRAYKRIIETAQFLFYVMVPEGLNGEGIPDMGIRVIQRVRLVHAAVRRMVREGTEHREEIDQKPYVSIDWAGQDSTPISQLELAYTLQTFSTVTLRSLRRVGIAVSDEEADDFNHCWNAIGYVLGIEEALLFDTAKESEEFFELIKEHFGASTDEGRQMTIAANQVLKQMLVNKLFILGWILSVTLPRPVQFRLLDKPTRQLLGVRNANPVERLFWFPLVFASGAIARFLNRFLKLPLTGVLLTFLGHEVIKYFSDPPAYLGKATFEIPTKLNINNK